MGGVEAEPPSNLSCQLQDLREVHTLLSWLRSKGFCLFETNISLAPCWASLINRGSPAVQTVIELCILLLRYNYRPALVSVIDQDLDYNDKRFCDVPQLLSANAAS